MMTFGKFYTRSSTNLHDWRRRKFSQLLVAAVEVRPTVQKVCSERRLRQSLLDA